MKSHHAFALFIWIQRDTPASESLLKRDTTDQCLVMMDDCDGGCEKSAVNGSVSGGDAKYEHCHGDAD